MNASRWISFLLLFTVAGLLGLTFLPADDLLVQRTVVVSLILVIAAVYVLHSRANAARESLLSVGADTAMSLERTLAMNDELESRLTDTGARLREAETSIQSLMDSLGDPVIVIDREHRITKINKAARDAFEIDDSDPTPARCFQAVHGHGAPCDSAKCALDTGESCKELHRKAGEDGAERLVEIRSMPLRDPSGAVIGAVEVVHDLNEQEKLALELQRVKEDAETARRARLEFVATISHEVRTPMNAVLGMADMLGLTDLTRKQRGYLRIIQGSGNLLLSLVSNLLDLAQLDKGRLELRKDHFYVAELLEDTLEVMGYQAYAKGIELAGSMRHDPSLQVVGDSQRLRQVLVNLVGNAIKFSDEGEVVVDVEVAEHGGRSGQLTVSIRDSGVGMSDEVKQNLFKPLARAAEEQIAGGPQGSGLGLAISKQLVELMGGELAVESQLGEGTTVTFTTPVELVDGPSVESTARTLVLRDRRIMVVSGNRAVAGAVCDNLEALRVRCHSLTDASGAVAELEQAAAAGEPFECAIIDVDLAGTDGLALARAIRNGQVAADVPIVLLTPIARPLEVGEISAIGGIRCVNKPVLLSELRHNLFRSLTPEQSAPGARATPQKDEQLRVLIAEDNPISRKLLRGLLKSLGYDSESVNDGPAILRALERDTYDLILMDCQMPGMDGDEVTRAIRGMGIDVSAQPVVVAITADVSAEHRTRCLQAGMDDFLAKPVRLDVLREGISRWSQMAGSRGRTPLLDDDQTPGSEDHDLLARIRDRAGDGSGGNLAEYINLFLTDTMSRLQVLQAALEHQDFVTFSRESHSLKGACLELGVSRMGRCCDLLRNASRDKRLDLMPEALKQLSEEFDRVRPILEAGKNGSG